MDKEMIRLGTLVEVSRKGTFVRKGYISSVADVSENRHVSVFYNDSHTPKLEMFVFEGEGWLNRDLYQTVGYLPAPLNQIRPVPFAGLLSQTQVEAPKEELPTQADIDLLL